MKTIITKIFAVILAAAVCASFAACSQSEPDNAADDNNSGNAPISTPENVPEDDEQEGDTAGDTGESDGEEAGDDVTAPEEETTASEESSAPEEEVDGDTDGEDGNEIPETDRETETSVIIPEEEQNAASGIGDAIAKTAESAVGYDFLFGGDSPEDGGFDNSGVLYYALTKNGISCPRQLGDIMGIGTKVGYDQLNRGDLVFFKLDDESNAFFGGVYAGDGNAVMSFSEGIPVKIVDITTTYYKNAFVHGVRAVG